MTSKHVINNKLVIYTLLLFISISCVKFPNSGFEPEPGTTIPSDFNWKMIKEVSINVQVNTIIGIPDSYIRVIKIYSSPVLHEGSLIASGAAKPGSPLNIKLTLSTTLSSIYIQEILPSGKRTIQKEELTSQQLNVTINNNAISAQASPTIATKASFASPSIPFPANYDVILGAGGDADILGFNPGESSTFGNTYKSYYIPSGVTRTGKTDLSNSKGHAILYVKGKLNLSSAIALNKASIVILDGGSVTVKGISTGAFVETIPIIYLQQNANLNSTKDVGLTNGISLVNKGTMSVYGEIDINGSSKLYNEGSLSTTKYQKGIQVTNSAQLMNSGNINVDYFDLTSYGSVTNDIGGKMTIRSYYQSNNTVLNNHHEIVATTEFLTSGGGIINNFCHITSDLTSLQGSTSNLFNGSIWYSQDFEINNSTINFEGGSIFKTANIHAIYAAQLISTSSTYAVFKCTGNVPDLRWASSAVNGKIEFVHSKLVDGTVANGRGLYEHLFNNNGSILSKNQTKNILASICNDAEGEIVAPPPAIVDNDSDGVVEDLDYDDNDPDVAFVSYFPNETTWGTIAFEDLWPWKGDYDLNDLVMGFKVTYFINASNKVTKMKFDYNIKASGSSRDLSAAFQLDNVNASNISSITRQPLLGSVPFNVSANGTEIGVSLAVIPLFNKVKDIVTDEFGSFLNTEEQSNHIVAPNESIEIRFIEPVELGNLSIARNVNFFIVANLKGATSRIKEIHLSSFLPTSKADLSLFLGTQLYPTDKYKFIDGMMWGLMLPDKFDYPQEYKSIETTYLHFREWALSGDLLFKDWYNNTSDGYRDTTLIYKY